jgi:aldehyde dehydrogenase (NAD+)
MAELLDLKGVLTAQKEARQGLIIGVEDRRRYLKSLRTEILDKEQDIIQALQKDLAKTEFEILGSEIGLVLQEIRYVLKYLRRWTRPQRKRMPLAHWPGKATVRPEPYGLVLIISPWNYPVQLAFIPLISAIAAGNSVHLKLSEKSIATNPVIEKIVNKALPNWLVTTSNVPGPQVEESILNAVGFDKIFFTGGSDGGLAVAKFAAKSLIPVSLELGGKSPALVDGTVSLKITAKRLVWAKMLNAGQSCIAPDYVLVKKEHEANLLKEMKLEFERVLGSLPNRTSTMACIVDKAKFEQLLYLIQRGNVYYTGINEPDKRWVHPTILTGVYWDDEIMQNEIFGPVLPVLTFTNEEDLFDQLKQSPKPLAFYLFSSNKMLEQKVLDLIPFGGGGSNHALMQIATSKLPHGGIGPSGMGASHGFYGFSEFSHLKSWHKTRIWPDIRLRYAPYGRRKIKLLKKLLR